MARYLIDTNVVDYFLMNDLPERGTQLLEKVIDCVPVLSVISEIELRCWQTDETTMQLVKEFVSDSIIINIDDKIISHCVELRKTKKIKLPDSLIAATALAHNLILLTNNEKDFSKIDGLEIVNPKIL
jgi:predicted nucleic acid-binding protein